MYPNGETKLTNRVDLFDLQREGFEAEPVESNRDMNSSDQTNATATLDPAFAALLCCPVCSERPRLRVGNAAVDLRPLWSRVFPIVNGLPDLRPESGVLPHCE